MENVIPPTGTVIGHVDIRLVIGKGQLPNSVSFARLHYVIDDDGTVKVETLHFRSECH